MSNYSVDTSSGLLIGATQSYSPNFGRRDKLGDISLLVIHNISLPPSQFGSTWIDDFFQNKLDPNAHPYFSEIAELQVSAHLLIRRSGECVQFVPFNRRAWHAGISTFDGRENCNDYSIGIELEGADRIPYTEEQYRALADTTQALLEAYPMMSRSRIVGHNQIAPGRKTDPGEAFQWNRYQSLLGDNTRSKE